MESPNSSFQDGLSPGSPPPTFASAVLRRIGALETKFSAQLTQLQQQGDRMRESLLDRAVLLAKDAAMAEFSQIVKGMSEVLQSQLRRMDHLEAQWRDAEQLRGMQEQPPVEECADIIGLRRRLLELEELLERCCQHEEALGAELLQLGGRVDLLTREPAEHEIAAGLQEKLEEKLEALLRPTQAKMEMLQQDSQETREKVEAQEEKGRCLRALQDARDEHYRALVDRMERANVEPRLKQLFAQSRDTEVHLTAQSEALELLRKRVEDQEAQALALLQLRPASPRWALGKPQARLEQRVGVLEEQVEGCQKRLDAAGGCLAEIEAAILRPCEGDSRSGSALRKAPRPEEEPETLRLPGAVS